MTVLQSFAHQRTPKRPVAREPLHLRTAWRIRIMIVRGKLEPGSRIIEHALCQEFGVSRTPLREALKVLAAEGLVLIKHSKGAWVTPIEDEHLTSLFEVIEPLGCQIGRLAIDRAEKPQLNELESLSRTLREQTHDNREFLDSLWEIHVLLAGLAKNHALLCSYRDCLVKILRVCYLFELETNQRDRLSADIDALTKHFLHRVPGPVGDTIATHWRTIQSSIGQHVANARPTLPDALSGGALAGAMPPDKQVTQESPVRVS